MIPFIHFSHFSFPSGNENIALFKSLVNFLGCLIFQDNHLIIHVKRFFRSFVMFMKYSG